MVHAGRRLSAAGQVAGSRREAGANGTSNKLGYSIAKPRPDFVTGHPRLCHWFAKTRRWIADCFPYFEDCAKSPCSPNGRAGPRWHCRRSWLPRRDRMRFSARSAPRCWRAGASIEGPRNFPQIVVGDIFGLVDCGLSAPIGFGRTPTLFRLPGKLIHADFPHRVIDLVTLEMRADHQSRPIEVRE